MPFERLTSPRGIHIRNDMPVTEQVEIYRDKDWLHVAELPTGYVVDITPGPLKGGNKLITAEVDEEHDTALIEIGNNGNDKVPIAVHGLLSSDGLTPTRLYTRSENMIFLPKQEDPFYLFAAIVGSEPLLYEVIRKTLGTPVLSPERSLAASTV